MKEDKLTDNINHLTIIIEIFTALPLGIITTTDMYTQSDDTIYRRCFQQ